MALTPIRDSTDHLQDIFPGWPLNKRSLTWLKLMLEDEGAEGLGEAPDSPLTRRKMANFITQQSSSRIAQYIEAQRDHEILPDQFFDWIDKTGRQPTWLLRELIKKIRRQELLDPDRDYDFSGQGEREKDYDFSDKRIERDSNISSRLPIGFSPKEQLIARIDYLPKDARDKSELLNSLQRLWIRQAKTDRNFAWYSNGGKTKERLKVAWEWYQDNHADIAKQTMPFSKPDDILEFLDGVSFSLEEKLYQLGQVKKKFKALEVAANRKGKQQTNLSLSDDVRQKLDTLSKRERISRTELVELLIEKAYEDGVLG